MVTRLFAARAPTASCRLLDPGCGTGEFIDGVLRACAAHGWPVPQIVGVELDPARAAVARQKFATIEQVTIEQRDFLAPTNDTFSFVIGNPPYVSILALSPAERLQYRAAYHTARGRFDLYVLFLEQSLRLAADGARLVFITPEKFLYVQTARPLRELLRGVHVEELSFAPEDTFAGKVTYPLITTIDKIPRAGRTRVQHKDGRRVQVVLSDSRSWLPAIEGCTGETSGLTLADLSLRVSCGVATGADSIFVMPTDVVPEPLSPFAHPTVSGRQILPSRRIVRASSLLAPYDESGTLVREHMLGTLGAFLREPERAARLRARTCVAHKPWYAFHDNFPLRDLLRPKLLCKDITEHPFFVLDRSGEIIPRHSVYYVVPADAAALEPLADYLNSAEAARWLRANCQRAANGFLRMQSHVLKRLPLPEDFAGFATSAGPSGDTLELLPA